MVFIIPIGNIVIHPIPIALTPDYTAAQCTPIALDTFNDSLKYNGAYCGPTNINLTTY